MPAWALRPVTVYRVESEEAAPGVQVAQGAEVNTHQEILEPSRPPPVYRDADGGKSARGGPSDSVAVQSSVSLLHVPAEGSLLCFFGLFHDLAPKTYKHISTHPNCCSSFLVSLPPLNQRLAGYIPSNK